MLKVLLILIFIRPFISSLAFPYLNSFYSVLILSFLTIWFMYKKVPLGKFKNLRYPLILFSLSVIISVAFSNDRLVSSWESYKYISGLLLFLIAAALDWNEKMLVIRTAALTGLVIGLLAIYQALFGFRHLLEYVAQQGISDPFVLEYVARKRVFLPFVTPNMLAGYLIMVIPLALIDKKTIWFTVPMSMALLLTRSIGALLSICLALGLYFYLQEKVKKRTVLLLIGILMITGLVFLSRSDTQKQHLRPIFSTLMRLGYWQDTLKIIKANALTGVGIGNFNLMQSRYAHNSYLQIWTEMGIMGIASIVWLIIAVFKSALKDIRGFTHRKEVSGLITGGCAFLVHNLIDFSFFLPEISLIWWLILGLSLDLNRA